MTLSERLVEYVRACFAGLWIQSFEHEDALAEINQLCRDEQWPLAVWDIDRGLQVSGQQDAATDSAHDPLAAIRAAGSLASPDGTTPAITSATRKQAAGANGDWTWTSKMAAADRATRPGQRLPLNARLPIAYFRSR